ncbi:MAG: diguanylate phosphodiesterase [Candidatus Acidoferrum typicum]|nr:diguanylate phosphodiesterase [Candidatus Acidoferrum typicum]
MKFIARQPILNRRRDVFAYELLFRSGIQNSFDGADLEQASASMFDTSFMIGLQKLTGGQRAFVNCPRDFLLHDYISLFPRDLVVIELLETIKPDAEVVDACRKLKQQGYLLALDDFVDTPDWTPLINIADFIKVDFRLTSRLEQRALAARYAEKGIRMLAEKVETQEEFSEAMDMGYSLFQGYFFCRPEMLQQRAIPADKLAYLELLGAAMAPDFDIQGLASKIKHEPSLTFKLLRYLNSAAFGLRCEIDSIPHALSMLGERELRKWIAVVCVGVMAGGKPDELMTVPLVRGRFCELLAPLAGMPGHANDLFLLGLLSVMDAILDQPLATILEELPIRHEIKDALIARTGLYWNLLEITTAHERADWEAISALARRLGIREGQIPEIYVSAVDWASALRHGASLSVP